MNFNEKMSRLGDHPTVFFSIRRPFSSQFVVPVEPPLLTGALFYILVMVLPVRPVRLAVVVVVQETCGRSPAPRFDISLFTCFGEGTIGLFSSHSYPGQKAVFHFTESFWYGSGIT